jgi:hypothetical protein
MVVTVADVDVVVEIVKGIALEHGFVRWTTDQPGVVAAFSEKRTLISVLRTSERPNAVDVVVFEMPAFRHSALALAVLKELREQLGSKFGAAVSVED